MGEPGPERSPQAELRRLNRAYRALCMCHRHITHAASEEELMQSLCQTLVDVGGYRMAWIGYPDARSQRVRPIAAAGPDEHRDYVHEISIGWADDELGRGPTGVALRTKRPAINRDSELNPRYAPWREQALERGFRSSIALPLLCDAECIGALMVYASDPDAFDADERQLLERFADDLAFGITSLRVRAKLDAAEYDLRRARPTRGPASPSSTRRPTDSSPSIASGDTSTSTR